jgi:RNA polymerase sigma-70 factor (ECF subfamily)
MFGGLAARASVSETVVINPWRRLRLRRPEICVLAPNPAAPIGKYRAEPVYGGGNHETRDTYRRRIEAGVVMEVQPRVTDAALIARSLADPECFGEIYDRYAAEIHRYVARRAGPGLADDLTAETFLVAFRGRHRYDPRAERALPWLYGIATNLVRRHARTERAQYRAWERTGADPAIADNHADAVAANLTAQATIQRLVGALGRLTARERDVVLLVAWGCLSYEETAAALAVPVGTVRSRLNRARRRLRDALGGIHSIEEQ